MERLPDLDPSFLSISKKRQIQNEIDRKHGIFAEVKDKNLIIKPKIGDYYMAKDGRKTLYFDNKDVYNDFILLLEEKKNVSRKLSTLNKYTADFQHTKEKIGKIDKELNDLRELSLDEAYLLTTRQSPDIKYIQERIQYVMGPKSEYEKKREEYEKLPKSEDLLIFCIKVTGDKKRGEDLYDEISKFLNNYSKKEQIESKLQEMEIDYNKKIKNFVKDVKDISIQTDVILKEYELIDFEKIQTFLDFTNVYGLAYDNEVDVMMDGKIIFKITLLEGVVSKQYHDMTIDNLKNETVNEMNEYIRDYKKNILKSKSIYYKYCWLKLKNFIKSKIKVKPLKQKAEKLLIKLRDNKEYKNYIENKLMDKYISENKIEIEKTKILSFDSFSDQLDVKQINNYICDVNYKRYFPKVKYDDRWFNIKNKEMVKKIVRQFGISNEIMNIDELYFINNYPKADKLFNKNILLFLEIVCSLIGLRNCIYIKSQILKKHYNKDLRGDINEQFKNSYGFFYDLDTDNMTNIFKNQTIYPMMLQMQVHSKRIMNAFLYRFL